MSPKDNVKIPGGNFALIKMKETNTDWEWRIVKTPTDYRMVEWGNVLVTTKDSYWGKKFCQFFGLIQVMIRFKKIIPFQFIYYLNPPPC